MLPNKNIFIIKGKSEEKNITGFCMRDYNMLIYALTKHCIKTNQIGVLLSIAASYKLVLVQQYKLKKMRPTNLCESKKINQSQVSYPIQNTAVSCPCNPLDPFCKMP
jgi:hypothetical protein